ncbi:urease subunit gamma [Streptomyces violascens]|uniref:urease subunit gamma n=1 Tax=Streptomyces violascens TaxID=67381 RepID=UPI0036ADA13C
MRLTPAERDRLLLFGATELARGRKARGSLLNVSSSPGHDGVTRSSTERLAKAVDQAELSR